MEDFADTVSDLRKNELLYVALEGRGAFRRFKDTLHRVGLSDEWYTFKHKAYVGIAREWCRENGIEYINNTVPLESEPLAPSECPSSTDLDMIIIPFSEKVAAVAAEIMCDALSYKKKDAEDEVRRMQSKKRIALAAIANNPNERLSIAGIFGAIPQYGVTGWELHPLAIRKEYQRHGVGTMLVSALEREVAHRGGVMIYLGSDDETGRTSLYGVNLYDDTYGKLANVQNTGGHPYTFYEKVGYKIVGVLPDANGVGKPDIWMAKRIRRRD
jgi:aminoglycoside 6'-N-acetyltransferase I